MSGSTIGGVVGGAIGFYFGGPQGAQIGWMIGAAVGGYVDPEVIKGPRARDASVQTTVEGAPRPIVYGKAVVAGNVIQLGPRVEHKHRERQGKGGPVQESYTYTRTFAIRICEGPISGIGRVWRNDKLIADFRNPSIPEDGVDAATWAAQINNLMSDTATFDARCTIYLGDETQLPDPTLEALGTEYGGGAGNVPAYRGTAYAVLIDEDVTSYDALPQYRWEVISNGVAGDNCTDIYEDAVWYFPLDEGSGTANEVIQNLDGAYTGGAGGGALRAGSGGSFSMAANGNYMLANHGNGPFRLSPGSSWTVSVWCRPDNATAGSVEKNVATLWASTLSGGCDWSFRLRGANKMTPQFVISTDGTNYMTLEAPSELTVGQIAYLAAVYEYDGFGASGTWKFYVNGALAASQHGVGANWGGTYLAVGGYDYPASYGFIGAVSDLAAWNRAFTAQDVADSYYSFNYWKALPDVPGAFVRSDGTVAGVCNNSVSSNQVMVSDAVLDLLDRVGITSSQVDVSALTSTVLRGAVIGRQMACQDALKLFQSGFFFDMPEWGNSGDTATKLRCVVRGGDPSFAITDDDLVWSDDDEDTRPQAVEFPRKINLISADPSKNYEATKYTAERRTDNIKAVGEATVELPLTQTGNERAQTAEKMHKIAWTEAEGRTTFQLPENFSGLVPSDTFTKDGKRWRADKVELQDGVVKVEAVRDRASAYSSSATGPVTAPRVPPSTIRGPTVFTAFNAPALWPADAGKTGMYVAARGLLTGWPGCYVELSVDGGTTYDRMATISLPAILGTLTADASGAATTFSVSTPRGTLDSVTSDQITAGLNRAVVVTNDTAEVFQFQTATETGTDTYDLTDLTRAELSTTADAHVDGDAFVFLDSTVVFVPIDPRYAGTVIWRPVTIGTTGASNETFSTTFDPGDIIFDGGVVT